MEYFLIIFFVEVQNMEIMIIQYIIKMYNK